jgi:hypothetical protein
MEVGNPVNPQNTEMVEFLVDSGAIYSVVPTGILERLHIQPLAEQEFRLADGSRITRRKGIALFNTKVASAEPTLSSVKKRTACFWAR